MQKHHKHSMTRIISTVIIYAGICSCQPTHVTTHSRLFGELGSVELLNKIDRAFRDTTVTATTEIATKLERQAVITAMTQNDVQQLSRIVGQVLTSNISDLLTAATRNARVLQQVIQMLTYGSTHVSSRIEKLYEVFNNTLIKVEAGGLSHDNHILSNYTAALTRERELHNETRLCSKTDYLMSQNNESIGILKRLPAVLQSVMITAHENASANLLNQTLRSITRFDVALNQSQRSMSELQQHTRIVGQILMSNISDLSTAAMRNAGGLQQVSQMLTNVSTHISTRIEKLLEIFNTTLRNVETALLTQESHILSNFSATLGRALELQNETRQCTRTIQLLSQYNTSIAILQRLPESLQSVILAAYKNASAEALNHALHSFAAFQAVVNQSGSKLRELSVNFPQSVVNITSKVNSIANNSQQCRELMTNVTLENRRLLLNLERISNFFGNPSITMQCIRRYGFPGTNVSEDESLEELCSPYDTAKRTAKIRTAHISQPWTKIITQMQDISEYLSPATSRIMQGSYIYTGCQDVFRKGVRKSDVYDIGISGIAQFRAWCDFDSRGGWMVMQRRFDGSVDFFKRWTDYVNGFGNLWGEHWLGLEKVRQLTKNAAIALSIYMETFGAVTAWANYTSFRIGDANNNFQLNINGYSGTAGDSFSYHNGSMFTSWDRNNDGYSRNCAEEYVGAWWYTAGCYESNLNGRYEREYSGTFKTNSWRRLSGYHFGLKISVMRMLV